MSATLDAATARLLASHVRATMTPDESRDAHDERYNVYLALDLDDADVLFVMGKRAIINGAEDIEAFTNGYAHALAGAPPGEHPASNSYLKGYEAGRNAPHVLHDAAGPSASPSMTRQA